MANIQTHLDSQERIRTDGSGACVALTDFKCQVERESWAQRIDTQGLYQVGVTMRGRD